MLTSGIRALISCWIVGLYLVFHWYCSSIFGSVTMVKELEKKLLILSIIGIIQSHVGSYLIRNCLMF